MSGSGLFSNQKAAVPHTMTREVEDLRNDVKATFAPMAAIGVDEFTNPLAAAAAGLLAATASSVAIQTILEAQLLAPGKAELAARARNVTFTTAGVTPADAPANAVITGKDAEGKDQTETVAISQIAATAAGVKAWSKITKIVYEAGQGAAATVSIGYGVVLGLTKKPKSRAGAALPVREIVDGALVATGAMSAANKTYTPATAPDGAHDYAVFYEYDPTA
jgi:hypothetical protein